MYKMVRRYRPTETPVPTVPLTLEQIREDTARQRVEQEEQERLHPTVLCSCYERIDARHLERHRRSKRHQAQINWYNNYYYSQVVARANQPVVAESA